MIVYRILLPVTNNVERARDQAAFVTNLPTSADEVSVVVCYTLGDEEADAPSDQQRIEQVETVKLVRDHMQEHGIDVELVEARDPPAEGILEVATRFDVDHIAMGSRKRTPAGKAVFGSVAQQVLLEADVPVTVVALSG